MASPPSASVNSQKTLSTKRKFKDSETSNEAIVAGSGSRSGQEEQETQILSKADKAKAKKRRKEESKALENPPSFSFDTRGFKGGRQIHVKDVRDFSLHLVSDEKAQQWLYVANKRSLRRLVILLIPGLLPSTLGLLSPPKSSSSNLPFPLLPLTSPPSLLPIFQELFSHALPVKAPGERNKLHSVYANFMQCPLSQGEKERRERKRKEEREVANRNSGGNKGPLGKRVEWMMMSKEEMIEQAYPELIKPPSTSTSSSTSNDDINFELWLRPDGWIECPRSSSSSSSTSSTPREVLAIDCEMCLTEEGSELTRVSVVDESGKRVYDTLVKPEREIKDYLTRYSGLTKEKLENVKVTLRDVQKELVKLIKVDTILVGQSLECDLRVLKLAHPHVIDTSSTYQHPRGPPFKASLKWLAQKWLKKEIQKDDGVGGAGHDSEEDARTALELVRMKAEKGPGFGEFSLDQETIFERIGRGQDPKTSVVVDHGTPSQWHGAKATKTVACSSDEEVLKGLLEEVEGHDLSVGRFMELSHALGWSQPSSAVLGKSSTSLPGIPSESLSVPDTTPPSTPQSLDTVYSSLNSHLKTLHASLPPLTALIILTGHGDPREMAKLAAKKANFDRLWKTTKQSEITGDDRWLEEDDRRLVEEVEKVRGEGMAFFCIK